MSGTVRLSVETEVTCGSSDMTEEPRGSLDIDRTWNEEGGRLEDFPRESILQGWLEVMKGERRASSPQSRGDRLPLGPLSTGRGIDACQVSAYRPRARSISL